MADMRPGCVCRIRGIRGIHEAVRQYRADSVRMPAASSGAGSMKGTGGAAQVAKLVDAAGLGPAVVRRGGSSPLLGTSMDMAWQHTVQPMPASPARGYMLCVFFSLGWR